ncbi:uncharacterized protein LOC131149572 isoform X2 [Malania oleifera]|uniref:uncharacterized protein LOC131149572 isoform X2 n=1 Tax=Malania oleifera TaxID=397392 RepID=UPI0025AE6C47|nr:uncharacterized protein LOC131149572 isoform X2 [Malania oleifera]
MNKGFWVAKGVENLNDGDAAFDNPSKIEPKRSHQWFIDATESELFPNKKQAVQALNTNLTSGMPNASVPSWEHVSGFQPVPNQFMDRLLGSDTTRSVYFSERNVSPVGTDSLNIGRKGIDEPFVNDSSVGLSISHAVGNSETSLSYGGIRKIKVNQVKDSENDVYSPKEHVYNREISSGTSSGQAHNRVNESSFISIGQAYSSEDDSVALMGHNCSRDDAQIRTISPSFDKGCHNTLSVANTYKEDSNIIPYDGFHIETSIPLPGPGGSCDLLYNQSSVQILETASNKELNASDANAVMSATLAAKSRPESISKNKSEFKMPKKEAPNSFPSNVRSLISTGMLDGVPVKYVSLSRQELRGIIKGSGYLCGCQSCNLSKVCHTPVSTLLKVLNAYEFERHAGCKTKHPNNHIYFENGKTIYQIVQELRSTPESKLFDAIQTVFGAPINQKSFRIWKESFLAATRELQRIYGKDEMNL